MVGGARRVDVQMVVGKWGEWGAEGGKNGGQEGGARREVAREYKEKETSGSGGAGAAWECTASALPPSTGGNFPKSRMPAAPLPPLPRCPAAPPACVPVSACSLNSLANQTPALLVGSAAPASCLPASCIASLPVPSCRPTRR